MKKGSGIEVPSLPLKDTHGEEVNLSVFIEDRQKTLIYIVPGTFSSSSMGLLTLIRDNMKILKSIQTDVAAISLDDVQTLKNLKREHNLNFTLLSARETSNHTDPENRKSLPEALIQSGQKNGQVIIAGNDAMIQYQREIDPDQSQDDIKHAIRLLATL